MGNIMRCCAWAALVGLGLVVGCKKTGEEKYTPSESNAREALEAALSQWRDGQAKPAQFTFGKVRVDVADQAWSEGQKLQAFEILGDESGASGPRIFSVKLKIGKGEKTTRYYVFGIDPLQVYSEADYQKLSGG